MFLFSLHSCESNIFSHSFSISVEKTKTSPICFKINRNRPLSIIDSWVDQNVTSVALCVSIDSKSFQRNDKIGLLRISVVQKHYQSRSTATVFYFVLFFSICLNAHACTHPYEYLLIYHDRGHVIVRQRQTKQTEKYQPELAGSSRRLLTSMVATMTTNKQQQMNEMKLLKYRHTCIRRD